MGYGSGEFDVFALPKGEINEPLKIKKTGK
jgi:hypothetical protein